MNHFQPVVKVNSKDDVQSDTNSLYTKNWSNGRVERNTV